MATSLKICSIWKLRSSRLATAQSNRCVRACEIHPPALSRAFAQPADHTRPPSRQLEYIRRCRLKYRGPSTRLRLLISPHGPQASPSPNLTVVLLAAVRRYLMQCGVPNLLTCVFLVLVLS